MDNTKLFLLIISLLNIVGPIMIIYSQKERKKGNKLANAIRANGCINCHGKHFLSASGSYTEKASSSQGEDYSVEYSVLECKTCGKVYLDRWRPDGRTELQEVDEVSAASMIDSKTEQSVRDDFGCMIFWMIVVGWIPLAILIVLIFNL